MERKSWSRIGISDGEFDFRQVVKIRIEETYDTDKKLSRWTVCWDWDNGQWCFSVVWAKEGYEKVLAVVADLIG